MNLFKKKEQPETVDPTVSKKPPRKIVSKDISEATTILMAYMKGKANLDDRVIEDELWWQGQHWQAIRKQANNGSPEPTSRWLFNTITNKHADMMDNIPQAVALPREKSDVENAKKLSSVLPVIFEYNGFEKTYADNAWELLKHGTAAYGVFWDAQKDVIGDISITAIDLLRIYWEPGVTDIQKSRNLFILDLIDTDILEQRYPQYKGEFKGGAIAVKQYQFSDKVDTSKKTVVVDWYYKKATPDGREVLHLVKFAGNVVLYSSEDDPDCADRGFYDHGKYPVVLDVLFPEKGTPVGFGEVAICKDPQLYIDKLMANILETSMINTKRRFFAKKTMNINKDQLLNNNEVLIEVDGDIDESRIKEFAPRDISPIYVNLVQMKQEEMKETASNRDVNSGGAGGGVTAASAIAALQEAGNKSSRDIIASSYRKFVDITYLVVELMRQFYDTQRAFRITNKESDMGYEFASFSNEGIKPQQTGTLQSGEPTFRKPIFDIVVKAQKKSPFSIMAQNELSKELLNMGAFNPERAQEMLGALMLMEFEGKEQVEDFIKQGQTLFNMLQQANSQIMFYEQILAKYNLLPGKSTGGGGALGESGSGGSGGKATSTPITDGIMDAQSPRTPYADALAKRSVPSV